MMPSHINILCCPRCKRGLRISELSENHNGVENGALVCEKGHQWPIEEGIPSLLYPDLSKEDKEWIAEYDEMAEGYDQAVKQYDDWLGINMLEERQRFSQFVPIEDTSRIMDVSIGTAANFVALKETFDDQMRRLDLHGLDVSWGMLRVSQRKAMNIGLTINLTHGSVFNIPYHDNLFDVVLHTGGINTFSDIAKALNEMLRIARKGGFVVVVDEGISPTLRETERGKQIIKANSLFAAKPPLEHIPDKAKDIEVSYVMNDAFYQIVFRK